MVDYVLAGLNRDYDPVVAAIGAIKTSINFDELFAQIAAFDQRMEMLGDGEEGGFNTSANLAYRGCGQYRSRAGARGTRGAVEGGTLPLLQAAATGELEVAVPNNRISNVNSTGIIPSARSVSSIIEEALVHAGIVMRRTRSTRRRRQTLSLTPTASTQIGVRILVLPTTSRGSSTS
uniref:Uncharacterized protein n=1 Tax=Triticum urartu TaxID=4572 RepID=A0A8R7P0Y5_TRIUA